MPPVQQPSPAPSGPKEKPKQMILTDDLRAHIGDVLACDLELEQPQWNAKFRSKLLKSVWVGQAPEKHHHTNISRKSMAMFTANGANSKSFAI